MPSELSVAQSSGDTSPERRPVLKGLGSAYGFVLTNALSFNITLGAPVILFAKALGASPGMLGVIGALTPLLTILQIPAAKYISRFGYRQFMLLGWSVRTIFIFLIALLPLLESLSANVRLGFLFVFLFFFNTLRGISSGAWLPWITEVVPEADRSRYLTTDGILLHLGGFCALLLSGLFLGGDGVAWKFSGVFLFSALAGAASLAFIRRIPEAPASEVSRLSGKMVPWRAIIFYPPFFKLVVFNLLFTMLAGSFGVFAVTWLRGNAAMPEGTILMLLSTSFLGAILSYPLVRRQLDRVGCRRVLRFALFVMTTIMIGWASCASGLVVATPWIVATLYIFWGVASAFFNLANARLMMSTMPEMGRTHFYAFFSTIVSLGFGLSPIFFGFVLDLLSDWAVRVGAMLIDGYVAFFMSLIFLGFVTASVVFCLEEKTDLELKTTSKKRIFELDGALRRLGRLLHR